MLLDIEWLYYLPWITYFWSRVANSFHEWRYNDAVTEWPKIATHGKPYIILFPHMLCCRLIDTNTMKGYIDRSFSHYCQRRPITRYCGVTQTQGTGIVTSFSPFVPACANCRKIDNEYHSWISISRQPGFIFKSVRNSPLTRYRLNIGDGRSIFTLPSLIIINYHYLFPFTTSLVSEYINL